VRSNWKFQLCSISEWALWKQPVSGWALYVFWQQGSSFGYRIDVGECVKWEPTARFAFSVQKLTGVGATEFRILCGSLVILKSCHTGFNETRRRGYDTMPMRFSVLLVYSTTIISLCVCLIFTSFGVSSYPLVLFIFSAFHLSSYLLSRDSSVGTATGHGPGGLFDSLQAKIFLFFAACRPSPWSTQPPSQKVLGALFEVVKQLGCEANSSPPSVSEVKNGAIYPLAHMSSWFSS
jgi:hypothetical protein